MPSAAITRFFPTTYVPVAQSFNLLLLSEGYTSEGPFATACTQLVDSLLRVTPFSGTRFAPSWLSVYRTYLASAEPGPALGNTPRQTPFRSTYDQATHRLRLDPQAVLTALTGMGAVPGEAGDPDRRALDVWPTAREVIANAGGGLIVILLPQSVDGVAVSGETEHPEGPAFTPGATGFPRFVATTTDGAYWPQFVARAIGRALGLGDEFALDDAGHDRPSADDADGIGSYANLVCFDTAPTTPPTADFKWFPVLTAAQRTRALPVVPNPPPAGTSDTHQIRLVEGGGGFRHGVYRASLECLMRHRVGDESFSLKTRQIGFCPICQHFLRLATIGTTNKSPKRVLGNQKLQFEEAEWPAAQTARVSVFPHALEVTTPTAAGTDPAGKPDGEFWTFKAAAGPAVAGGLRITDLKLMNQSHDHMDEDMGLPNPDVAKVIEFRDLEITFDDGTTATFDIAKAFQNATDPPELIEATDGSSAPTEAKLRWGLRLKLVQTVNDVPIQVELSIVLKARNLDVEPTGFVVGAKFFPQIAMTWSLGGKGRVTSFRGTVFVVPVPTLTTHPDLNISSALTDRTVASDGRVAPGGPAAIVGAPMWANIFDYLRPHLEHEFEFVGVYGPPAPEAEKLRTGTYAYPPLDPHSFVVEKPPRQGAYDNVHVHGFMATDSTDPAHGPLVHAPACAEACFHLHWRWGTGISDMAEKFVGDNFQGQPKQFMGWGPDRYTKSARTVRGAPLIPPNQRLRVALTKPDATRANRSGVIGSDVVVDGTTPLDPKEKAIWYTADVVAPNPGEKQVILEQGIAWAWDYSVRVKRPGHHTYETIRWYTRYTPPVQQVPDGNTNPGGPIAPERL